MKYNIEKLISLTDLKLKNEIFLKNLENERKLMKFNDVSLEYYKNLYYNNSSNSPNFYSIIVHCLHFRSLHH